ncbi:hypothetical protein [Geomicrobium sp. JCM 19039]|uniref:hypothetical protein n=1 Tax=Geomicrobium sp. JCM 19039 TaxID=1460636 RepID=UPI00045F1B45|nr:hypothetical protein [Geomicrobium sp. JCM 19039]GAK11397.1 hypothetical protein JCM19039_1090 [Geomicrobium sp. JCM 19039]
MTEKKQEKKPQAKASASKTSQSKPETKFHVGELRAHCRQLFGVKPEVFDGALFDIKTSEITKSDVKEKIDTFLTKKTRKGAKA